MVGIGIKCGEHIAIILSPSPGDLKMAQSKSTSRKSKGTGGKLDSNKRGTEKPANKFVADKLTRFVSSEVDKLADPGKAPAMAAYMKVDSGFYGVQKPDRIPIFKEVKKNFKPATRS